MTKPSFRLQFDASEVVELTSRYDYAADHEARQAGRRARARGYYTKSEFMAVCGWKSIRSSGLAKANSESIIHSRTRIALAVDNDRGRMRELTKLNGVGVPVASTLLHFAFPRRYPILDYRVLESLGNDRSPPYSIKFWLSYVDACQRIAREHHVHIRTLDKALWQHSREKSAR